MSVHRLLDMTWEEIRACSATGAMAILPLGSVEQHGPHLPIKTDTALITAVVEATLARLPDDVQVALAPTCWLGASHHHLPFFALSVTERTYIDILTQLGTCLADGGFQRLFILNGHGGNTAPLRVALNEIRRVRPAFLVAAAEYWSLGKPVIEAIRTSHTGGTGHAGEVETSLMLHLAPNAVKNHELLTARIPCLPTGFERDLVSGGPVSLAMAWDQLSASGVLGDPGQATADKGQRFFDGIVNAVVEALLTFYTLDPSALQAA
ncbi:creatininase family protein [candidate division KSB3 bacterium]|uniref:Creatininase family protein n=1 Tax=candidate division KSB3 bacterium TaxID=2044937 RepID=A0A9D5Q6W3_9BACT|nr:creatininase family protein [candidate division KSB3 bacterium]MBD3326220.1 creatininase family protein [candidate division KSB3 bacterium]